MRRVTLLYINVFYSTFLKCFILSTFLGCIVTDVTIAWSVCMSVQKPQRKGQRVKPSKAVHGNPSQSYGASLAIWDYTVLPAIRHKRTRPAITPANQAGTRFIYPEGWKAE